MVKETDQWLEKEMEEAPQHRSKTDHSFDMIILFFLEEQRTRVSGFAIIVLLCLLPFLQKKRQGKIPKNIVTFTSSPFPSLSLFLLSSTAIRRTHSQGAEVNLADITTIDIFSLSPFLSLSLSLSSFFLPPPYAGGDATHSQDAEMNLTNITTINNKSFLVKVVAVISPARRERACTYTVLNV